MQRTCTGGGFDPAGPRITARAWDREVAAVNRFYGWQVRVGHVAVNPVPQRQRRAAPVEAGGGSRAGGDTPATYATTGGWLAEHPPSGTADGWATRSGVGRDDAGRAPPPE
ncbi:hypothetical protein WEI85_00490 [Actinomycetes bacterium KLBMP 9797]